MNDGWLPQRYAQMLAGLAVLWVLMGMITGFVTGMAALDGTTSSWSSVTVVPGWTQCSRTVYLINLTETDAGSLVKTPVIDLAAVPDPNLNSLPPLHGGDVGLGNPYRVTCESIEAIHPIAGNRLLLGCDNNLPNTGRNPDRADDDQFIVVKVPGLRDR